MEAKHLIYLQTEETYLKVWIELATKIEFEVFKSLHKALSLELRFRLHLKCIR